MNKKNMISIYLWFLILAIGIGVQSRKTHSNQEIIIDNQMRIDSLLVEREHGIEPEELSTLRTPTGFFRIYPDSWKKKL